MTEKQKEALKELATIADIKTKKYGMNMLKKGMSISNYTMEEILYKDFKSYKVDDDLLGIGQILIMDIKSLEKRLQEIVEFLNIEAVKEKYKVLTLFVTDVFDKRSYCFYNSEAEDYIKNSFNLDSVYEGVVLEGVLSRKVQIAPYLMETLNK